MLVRPFPPLLVCALFGSLLLACGPREEQSPDPAPKVGGSTASSVAAPAPPLVKGNEPPPGPRAIGPVLAESLDDSLSIQVYRAGREDGQPLTALALRFKNIGSAVRCISQFACPQTKPGTAGNCSPTSYLWPVGQVLIEGKDPGGNTHVFALARPDPEDAHSLGYRVLAFCLGPNEERLEFFQAGEQHQVIVEHWAPGRDDMWNASGLYEPLEGAGALRYDRLPEAFPRPPAPGAMVSPETRNQLLGRPPTEPRRTTLSW